MKSFDISEIKKLATDELLQTPLVQYLLEVIQKQSEEIEILKAEIRLLKGHSPKPPIKPGNIEKPEKTESPKEGEKRAGSAKRKKTQHLKIHKEEIIEVEEVQKDWIFKGYNDYVVQDILIQLHNTKVRLKKYLTPEGKYVTATLPEELQGYHFGTTLRKFILYQYYHCHVTQPLLYEQLIEMGVDISEGELNNLIIENKEIFHQEKEAVLAKGLEVCSYIQTDDTGARHKGKNGYCTVICNDLFTYFKSGSSKSRINFLELLRTPQHEDYQINSYALIYMEQQGLPAKYKILLECLALKVFSDKTSFKEQLIAFGITAKHALRVITEGALIGSIIEHGMNKDMAIISDDAGQFNVFFHALCWVHTERNIQKVHCFTTEQTSLLESKLADLWKLYQDLKRYKENPVLAKKKELYNRFDSVFTEETGFLNLDQALEKAEKNKQELLLVLDRPEIPLHNNTSERDIREYVKKRKISGSTRSEEGKKCRDTFASLKKTCRKLDVSFWEYLDDRIKRTMQIPLLSDLITPQSIVIDSG